MTINGNVGDVIFIKCANPRNTEEYSVFRIIISESCYKGELEDIFLAETTGFEED